MCFKPAEGQAFASTETEFTALLDLGDDAGAKVHEESDKYGYRWVVVAADDFQTLVTRVHVTNTTLQENGYGPQLLCSVFGFAPTPQAGARPTGGLDLPRLPLQARDVLPLRTGGRRDAGTTRSSSG